MSRIGVGPIAILISMARIGLIFILLVLLTALFAMLGGARGASPGAPGDDPIFATVPFDRWIAQGDRAQIPWRVQIAPPVLGFGLRLYVDIKVTVQGKELARRPQGELILLLQFSDSEGRVYRDHGRLDLAGLQESGPKLEYVLSVGSLVAPGDYRIAVAIFDTAANEYSFASKTMQVRAPSGDALPEIWRAVPAVETLPAEAAPEAWYYPTLTGRLYLPLETRLPVHVEVLLNLPSPDLPRLLHYNLMGAFIEQFKAVSQLDVRNGSLDMALFDLDRGRVGFEQTQVRELDWPALRTALVDASPRTIDVQSLGRRSTDARFFVSEFNRRSQAPQPLRVVILLGAPTAFQQRINIPALTESNARIYYLRYPLLDRSGEDLLGGRSITRGAGARNAENPVPRPDDTSGLHSARRSSRPLPTESDDATARILKPLHPRTFSVRTPEQFRKALAAILDEISHM